MVSEQDTSAIGNALVVLGAAGIVIPAFARFRISPVIGFILVGLLVGPSGLGALAADYPWLRHITIASSEDIALFGEFGIILLLFSIGLELSFRRLWQLRKLVFGIGAAELLLGGAILGTALFLLGDHSTAAAYGLGIALAAQDFAVATGRGHDLDGLTLGDGAQRLVMVEADAVAKRTTLDVILFGRHPAGEAVG